MLKETILIVYVDGRARLQLSASDLKDQLEQVYKNKQDIDEIKAGGVGIAGIQLNGAAISPTNGVVNIPFASSLSAGILSASMYQSVAKVGNIESRLQTVEGLVLDKPAKQVVLTQAEYDALVESGDIVATTIYSILEDEEEE